MSTYIYDIKPFDAQKEFTLTFSYSGGFQCFKNKLIIKDNDSLAVVYEKEIESFQLRHLIPENTLLNGRTYLGQIYIFDVDGNICSISPQKQFRCLKKPTFRFKNIEENQIVKNSSYIFELEYSQENEEELQSFQFTLYNGVKNVLFSSPTMYDTSDLSYKITSLSDAMQYCIRATGVTINGVQVDTGYTTFNVTYVIPQQWYHVELKNSPKIGAIQIKSNMVSLEGICTKDPVPYIDWTFVDLREEDVKVIFPEGFLVKNDGTFIGSGYDPTRNQVIATFKNGADHLRVEYKIAVYESTNDIEMAYLDLYVTNGDIKYYIQSDEFIDIPKPEDILVYCILKQSNLYKIRFVNLTKSREGS